MAQEKVDWDFIESKWNSLEKTNPEARRISSKSKSTVKGNSTSKKTPSKGKQTKKSLIDAYSTPINGSLNDDKPIRRKRSAFGTQDGDSLPDIGVGRQGTPLKLAEFDETITPRSPQPRSRQRIGERGGISTPKRNNTNKRTSIQEPNTALSQGIEGEEVRFDSSTFIEKKMMLPYLDKFLYIGTKIDRMTADLADEQVKEQVRIQREEREAEEELDEGGGLTWRSEGSPRSQHPETESVRNSARSSMRDGIQGDSSIQHTPRSARSDFSDYSEDYATGTPYKSIDDMQDMYFHRSNGEDGVQLPKNSQRHNETNSSTRSKQVNKVTSESQVRRQREIQDSSDTTGYIEEEEEEEEKVKRLKSNSNILHTNKSFKRRESETNEVDDVVNNKKKKNIVNNKKKKEAVNLSIPISSGGRLIVETRISLNIDQKVLSSRYVRFWEAAQLNHLSEIHSDPPKVRSVPWLLQLIEDIYDAARNVEQSVTVFFSFTLRVLHPFFDF